MSDYSELMGRYRQASSDWDNWKSLYMEAYDFTFPDKNPYFEEYNQTQGQRKNLQVFDNTLNIGARRLVSKLHANLVPPSLQWFQLEPTEIVEDENEKKELEEYLQTLTKIIYNSLNGSNFDLAINEGFHDLIIGTMALQVFPTDDDDNPIVFKTCPVDKVAPEQDVFDNVNTVWREFCDVHHQDIPSLWPDAEIPESMQIRINEDNMAKFNFVEGVIYDPNKKNYRIVVMWQSEAEFLVNKRVDSSPWVVGRWSKSAREIGGRGPAIEALPTTRTLNVQARYIMEAAAMSATPPLMGFSDGVFNPNTYTIRPNDIIPISPDSAMNMPLKKLDVSGDVQFGELTMNDLRTQINQIMYVDPTRPVQSPSMTATEIMIRQQQFLEEIAPAFARIEIEILPKLIERVLHILTTKGLIPPEINREDIRRLYRVRFKSPLEQSQQLQDVQTLMQYNQGLQQIVGQEQALAAYKLQELPTYLARKYGVDLDVINSPDEVAQAMQMAMQSQQPQGAPQAPDATENMAEASTTDLMGVDEQ